MKKNVSTQITQGYLDKKLKQQEKQLKVHWDRHWEKHGQETVIDMQAIAKKHIDELEERMEKRAYDRHFELMNRFDALAGEVLASREERITSGAQISSNTKRIEKLEKKVFKSVSTPSY